KAVVHEGLLTEEPEWFAELPEVSQERSAAHEPSATASNGAGLEAPGELRRSLPTAPALGAGLARDSQVPASGRAVSSASAWWQRLRQLSWSRGLAAAAAALLVWAWFTPRPPR